MGGEGERHRGTGGGGPERRYIGVQNGPFRPFLLFFFASCLSLFLFDIVCCFLPWQQQHQMPIREGRRLGCVFFVVLDMWLLFLF